MKLIVTVTGTILLIRAIQTVLPLGNIGKYMTYLLGLFFMAAVLEAAGGLSFGTEALLPESVPTQQTEELTDLRKKQIFREYTAQLANDIRRSVPSLSDAKFAFRFSEDPFGEIVSIRVIRAEPPDERETEKLCNLYGLDREVIRWSEN